MWEYCQTNCTHANAGNDGRPQLQIATLPIRVTIIIFLGEGFYTTRSLGFSSWFWMRFLKKFILATTMWGRVLWTSNTNFDQPTGLGKKNPSHLKMIFIAGNEPFTQGKLKLQGCSLPMPKVKRTLLLIPCNCGAYEQGINTNWKMETN